MDPEADQTLHGTVEAARRGDRQALAELLARHLEPLAAFVRVQAGPVVLDRESVHDLVQSVCREALADLSRIDYRGDRQFRSWLFLLATRKILDRAKFHRKDKRDVWRERPIDTALRQGLAAAGGDVTPSRVAAAREELVRFEAAVALLPDDQRDAVAYVKLLGLAYDDVAARMRRSESSVRGLVARGLAAVAEELHRGDPES